VPPGRAFRGDTGVEVQLALLGGDPAGQAQAAVLAALAERRRADPPPPPGLRPFRVDVLPARVTLDEARELLDAPPPSAHWALVGVGGDELTAYGVDLARVGPGFVIGGPARSGRSTALLAAAASFLHAGTEVVVLAPRPSPLRELVGAPGVVAVSTAADPRPEELAELLNGVTGPLALLVDDAELLHPSDAQPLLQQVLRDGRDVGHVLVLAGTTEDLVGAFRGFTVDARKSRTGMILSPESHAQGDLLGVRLPRSAAFSGPPGRALLVQGGSAVLVQVPLVTAAELQI